MIKRKSRLIDMKHFLKELLKKYGHIWILGYGFIYLTWFMHLEKTVTSNYHIMHSSLDDMIPFNEYFVIPYLLWFAYVTAAIAYLFFKNKEEYYRLCAFLFTGMTLSLLICTLSPIANRSTRVRISFSIQPPHPSFSPMSWHRVRM